MGQPNGIQNKFSDSKIWQEVYYVIYLFQFLKTFPDSIYLYKTMETLNFKNVWNMWNKHEKNM